MAVDLPSMKSNIKLLIAYDGTNYLGWQKTKTGASIEGTLQPIIEKVLQEQVILQAASRTDAGVHAFGQVVNFFTSKPELDLGRFQYSLNSLLPKDIAIRSIELAQLDFHPTLDCLGKEYRYSICNSPNQMPHHRLFSWHCPYKLELSAMREAAKNIIGRHDFAAFCNVKKNAHYEDYIREITDIRINELADSRLEISIRGNHFLYKMARNIVGTIVYVGKGMLEAEAIDDILRNRDRTKAGITAPAHGLSLNSVFYT